MTASVAFFGSCDGLGITKVCTQIGCDSGLQVQLQGTAPTPLTITATAPGGAPQTVHCSTAACAQYVFFRDFTPASVTITVQGAGVDVTRTVQPSYRVSQPNGKDCPPTCRTATVTIPVG